MADETSASSDHYVSGGVNWTGFELPQLVAMVSDQASVPQLEGLAQDWHETGEGVTEAAEYLADALDDLMNFWTGSAAEKARHVVALNAQWISDLGTTAREMANPINEAAGALRAAQEAMPQLPQIAPAEFPGIAPRGAADIAVRTDSPLGAALGAAAESSSSGFAAQAELEELKRIAVETMQRFEAAVVGIDQTTPRFLGQDTVLRTDSIDSEVDPADSAWARAVTETSGVDARWQALTGTTGPSGGASFQRGAAGGFADGMGSFAGSGFGGVGDVGVGAVPAGPASGQLGSGAGLRPDTGLPGRGMPATAPGAVIGGAGNTFGGPGAGAMGAAPVAGGAGAGAGAGAGGIGEQYRRRVPVDADDPFETGQKASPPVIGL